MPSENEILLEDRGWFNKDTSTVWVTPAGHEELYLTKNGGWVLCLPFAARVVPLYRKIDKPTAARWFRKYGLGMPDGLRDVDKQDEV